MEMMPVASWTDFKQICITTKNLNCQYRVPAEGGYDLYGPDGGVFMWVISLRPGVNDADIDDFEDNHKAAFNFPVGTRQYTFPTSDYEFAPKIVQDTCPAGSTKAVLLVVDENLRLNGGKMVTDGNAVFGDWIECQLIDHDNLLGYGVDTVLKNWIPKWVVDWKNCSEMIVTPYIGAPPTGMYLRFTYHSVGAQPVGFAVNLWSHRPI